MDKPWKVILAFLGVFVAGAIFGGFFSLGIGRKIWEIEAPVMTAKVAVPPAKPPGADGTKEKERKSSQFMPQSVQSAQMMRRVTNQLGLSAEQKASIAPIIQRSLQDIWRQQQNLYRETTYITQRMKEDIAKELTAEQQKQLDELWTKALDQFRKRQAEAQAQAKAEAQQKRANASSGNPADKSESGERTKSSSLEGKEPAPAPAKPSSDDPK
jgi:hypothetical protein